MKRSVFTPHGAVLLLLLASACASPQKNYEEGRSLEAKGDFSGAAEYYVRVLDKERGWEEVRVRLEVTGKQAVDAYLEAARAAEGSERYEDALGILQRMEGLRGDATGVGVTLAVPPDYAAYRQGLQERAVGALLQRGDEAERAGDWRKAIEAYERAAERYEPSLDQAVRLREGRGRALLRWGEEDMRRGRHRSAYERAGQATAFVSAGDRLGSAVRALQEDALDAGTRYVAFLPFGATEQASREMSRGMAGELNEVLRYDHWASPPLFIEEVDRAEVYRLLRRYGADRGRVSDSEAFAVGRDADADYVVVGEVSRYVWEETDLKEEQKQVKTRGRNPRDTTFTIERYRLRLRAEADVSVLDPRQNRRVRTFTVRADVDDRVSRGRYPGDPNDLDLRRSDRELFDADALDKIEQELEDKLLDALSEGISETVYRELLQLIP